MNVGKIVTVCGKNFEYFLWNGQVSEILLVLFCNSDRIDSDDEKSIGGLRPQNYQERIEKISCIAWRL